MSKMVELIAFVSLRARFVAVENTPCMAPWACWLAVEIVPFKGGNTVKHRDLSRRVKQSVPHLCQKCVVFMFVPRSNMLGLNFSGPRLVPKCPFSCRRDGFPTLQMAIPAIPHLLRHGSRPGPRSGTSKWIRTNPNTPVQRRVLAGPVLGPRQLGTRSPGQTSD